MQKYQSSHGFTLIELILVMSIMTFLLGFITINLITSQHHASINSAVTEVYADMREQQMKAMNGQIYGTGASAYGVHFSGSNYVLFGGTTYNPGDPNNFTVALNGTLQFASSDPDIIFSRLSGEIQGYSPSNNIIIIQDTGVNQKKTLQFNRYGVVTQVQ